ncbi:hypothetical protein A2303_07465 [Candidatus Falkowbacteria bacterium RIFOXYB2_FULL_47_14]|uniref:Uncharacterized protein n=1 Tax=Candidatus Falkowbacteria bacterium RIFOXYA2_FULL_47_19 TaxID=1797994 RepID=A0A1F5SH81_9BACT|nr:MAG: hypothetical protein A2227_01215 [Candidatus Falkowbacteria bacterium RIFOXYA2_FULL_47_19]OGF34984.1 MAG: hypothetical protein A2468_07170 [Candidatus Falkowbacteria bacterium RIFOXYC2_FULL_46_15]OGF43699.1 MAG: hypothetical protein A2303_07465 [Candidatus Falkowbacteria bacterium RIFOXYB2_FULL_47_14]
MITVIRDKTENKVKWEPNLNLTRLQRLIKDRTRYERATVNGITYRSFDFNCGAIPDEAMVEFFK